MIQHHIIRPPLLRQMQYLPKLNLQQISNQQNLQIKREHYRKSSERKQNLTHIDPKQPTPLHNNADTISAKKNVDNSEDSSSTNSHAINTKSKKSIVISSNSTLK